MQKQHIGEIPASYKEEALAILEALTDPTITHLALDDLFLAVLGRIRTIMAADNIAILLLDEDRHTLQIRAVLGLEEVVANDVHIPLGQGFAGRIAAQAAPIIVHDTSTVEIITPILREQLRSLLGVPLIVHEQVIGVLHIGMKQQHLFTNHDVVLLTRVANCLAQAIERTLLLEAQQQAKAELLEAEQRAHIEAIERANELETIFDTITDGLIVYGQQGQILRANSAACQMLGIETQAADFANSSLASRAAKYRIRDEYGHQLATDAIPVSRLLHGERLTSSQAIDVRLCTLDGKDAQFTITGAPFYDQRRQVSGAVCILRDVTTQRQARRRLEILDALIEIVETLVQSSTPTKQANTSEHAEVMVPQKIQHTILALAQRLLSCSHAIIIEIEPRTHILSPLEMVGFPTQLEQHLRTHLTGAHLSTLVNDANTIALLEKQEHAPFDITQSPLLQRLFPVSSPPNCLFVPIYVAHHLTGLLGVTFADRAYRPNTEDSALITAISKLCALALQYEQQIIERDKLLEARDLLNEQLEQVNALQSSFISVVGHEFRTALTGIEGFSALLSTEEFSAEEVRDFANDIHKDAIRLHRMITDLLDLEQMKKGKMQLHLEQVDINTLLTETVKRFRLILPEHIHLYLHLDTQHPPHLQADPDKLLQVISNLLSNAVKYSPDGGDIAVSSYMKDKELHMLIQDHGIGIPPEKVKNIFAPYHRVASKSTRHIEGTGLGLGIAKQIVEMHQGQIWAESTPGQGSLFHITLPLEAQMHTEIPLYGSRTHKLLQYFV